MSKSKDKRRDMHNLSEREEKLLSKFHDGACGRLGSWRASKLLERSEAARDFISAFESAGDAVRTWALSEERSDLHLWDKISMRIEQEERAQFFLGERAPADGRKNNHYNEIFFGISGAVVAACLVFVFVGQGPKENEIIAKNQDPETKRVANAAFSSDDRGVVGGPGINYVSGSPNRGMPLLRTRKVRKVYRHSPIEVDWMRSDGRVRMLQNPRKNSVIIWVKRSPVARGATQMREKLTNPSGIRMLEDGVPRAVAVTGATPR